MPLFDSKSRKIPDKLEMKKKAIEDVYFPPLHLQAKKPASQIVFMPNKNHLHVQVQKFYVKSSSLPHINNKGEVI